MHCPMHIDLSLPVNPEQASKQSEYWSAWLIEGVARRASTAKIPARQPVSWPRICRSLSSQSPFTFKGKFESFNQAANRETHHRLYRVIGSQEHPSRQAPAFAWRGVEINADCCRLARLDIRWQVFECGAIAIGSANEDPNRMIGHIANCR